MPRLLALSLFTALPPAYAGEHGEEETVSQPTESHEGGHEKKEQRGNFSAADLDLMKQSALLDNLDSDNYQASEYSMYYFEQKGEAAVPPLLAYLKRNDDDDKRVSAAIYTIGRLKKNGSRAVPVITHFLNHSNFDIRTTTIAALGKIGKASDPAVPEIARYLDNDNAWVRSIAFRALKDIDTKQSMSYVTQYENRLKMEEERKNLKLMNKGNAETGDEPKKDN